LAPLEVRRAALSRWQRVELVGCAKCAQRSRAEPSVATVAKYALLAYLMPGVASGAQISHSSVPTGWP
jgi:hypothetical protein